MERFCFEDVINMVYELLFLGLVKMFPQELGKCLISQRISRTLFIVEFTDSFRVFKVPHPWDRSLLPSTANAEFGIRHRFSGLLFTLPHLGGLGVHLCSKQKPHSNNTEMEPIYATILFFFLSVHISFLLSIFFFLVETLVTIEMPQYAIS